MAVLPRPQTTVRDTSPTPYEQHRDYVLGVLGRRCGWLDPSDREGLLHDAYAVLLEKQRDGQLDPNAMRAPQVRAYLTQTALNKAMDEGKRAGRRRSVSLDDERLGLDPADPSRGLDEQLSSRLDDARIREIVAELPARQQQVIKLRFFFNRPPQEIQRYLGVTDRVYRRELERATRHVAERFDLVREGTFCRSRRSLILAYVTGVAGPNRMTEARRHLNSCPACMHWAVELRAAVGRAAALAPPIPVVPTVAHLFGPRLHAIAHAARRRGSELAAGPRTHISRVLAHADPSKTAALSNLRPGTAALLVAGCLATGSTATYCIVNGIPAPLRSVIGISASPDHRRLEAAAHRRANPNIAVARNRATTLPPLLAHPAGAGNRNVHPPAPARSSRPAPAPTQATPQTQAAPAATATATPARAATSPGSSQAQQVHLATSAEFGVGNGSPAPPSASSSSKPGASGRAASSASSGGSPPPPKPSTHLPEFDP